MSNSAPHTQSLDGDTARQILTLRSEDALLMKFLEGETSSADVDWQRASRAIIWLVGARKGKICRSDGESVSSGRPPKGILRNAGSARSSELTSHMISPRMSADTELPGGMPIGEGHSLAASGNTSGKLGSSQLARSAA